MRFLHTVVRVVCQSGNAFCCPSSDCLFLLTRSDKEQQATELSALRSEMDVTRTSVASQRSEQVRSGHRRLVLLTVGNHRNPPAANFLNPINPPEETLSLVSAKLKPARNPDSQESQRSALRSELSQLTADLSKAQLPPGCATFVAFGLGFFALKGLIPQAVLALRGHRGSYMGVS